MPNTAQSDIAYQPTQKGFSYANPESPKTEYNKPKIFLTLILELFVLFLIFFVFLGILNYFKIISLSSVSTIFTKTPKSNTAAINSPTAQQESKTYNLKGTNEFTFEGKLKKYDQNSVEIEYENKIISLEYTYKSKFFLSKDTGNSQNSSSSAEELNLLVFSNSVLKQQNINKNVVVIYKIEGNKNIMESLSLYQ